MVATARTHSIPLATRDRAIRRSRTTKLWSLILGSFQSPLYRAILSVFVAERARFTRALRPSEIQATLVLDVM